MKAGSRGEGSKKSYLSMLGGRSRDRSQRPRIDKTGNTQEEELLIYEIHDFQLRHGADQKVAAGAARVCMSLISSRESTPEAMKDLGPLDLVSLAKANLGLSSAATACLLAHLVRQDSTAARLATAGTDFDFSHHRCSPVASDAECIRKKGVVESDANTTRQSGVGAKANGIVLQGTENEVVLGAEKEEAVIGAICLSLACRTWRDTISSISDTARRGGVGCCTGGADPVGATQGKPMYDSAKETTLSSCETSWCCSLESRKSQCRPTGKENNERSTIATAETAERVDGSQHCRVRQVALCSMSWFRVDGVVLLAISTELLFKQFS